MHACIDTLFVIERNNHPSCQNAWWAEIFINQNISGCACGLNIQKKAYDWEQSHDLSHGIHNYVLQYLQCALKFSDMHSNAFKVCNKIIFNFYTWFNVTYDIAAELREKNHIWLQYRLLFGYSCDDKMCKYECNYMQNMLLFFF